MRGDQYTKEEAFAGYVVWSTRTCELHFAPSFDDIKEKF